jgi:CTP synthase
MGNYERFLGRDLGPEDYMTSGMVYQSVIERERNLGYGGKCVEAVPHVRDEIIARFEKAAAASKADVSVIEIGGTIGDFQNALFIDAARVIQMRHWGNAIFIMVSYLPVPGTLGEMKTRPTQHAVSQLNSYGVHADFIIARSTHPLDKRRKEKLAVSCNVTPDHIISAPDVDSVYDVPLNFERDHLSDTLLKDLHMRGKQQSDLSDWKRFAERAHNGKKSVKIAIVGKYFDSGDFVLSDAYLSVIEALKYSAFDANVKPELTWLNARHFEKGGKSLEILREYDGILVPGGFGETGIEGKMQAIKFAREQKIPYFGLCYGMQLLCVEYARNVVGLKNAHTVEINPQSPHPIIDIMPEQKEKIARRDYGGSMRLGAYPAYLKPGTIARGVYKSELIEERHRHRYEVNPAYIERLEKAGLVFSGVSPDRRLMEIAELPKEEHPFFVGTQFHPELQARPLSPHPLFTAFIKASLANKKGKK